MPCEKLGASQKAKTSGTITTDRFRPAMEDQDGTVGRANKYVSTRRVKASHAECCRATIIHRVSKTTQDKMDTHRWSSLSC